MRDRVAVIDYIKAICAVLVIIQHCDSTFVLRIDDTIAYTFIIKMAVPVFMMVSGYALATKQCDKKMRGEYSLVALRTKAIRYTLPMIPCILFYFLAHIVNGESFSVGKVIGIVFLGEFGRGAYYWLLMLEYIFVGPLVVWVVGKLRERGLAIIFVCNVLYELIIRLFGVDKEIYDVLLFRYLLAIGMGAYIFYRKERMNILCMALSMVVGVGYIAGYKYWGYEAKLFTYWIDTSMMVTFWLLPIVHMIIHYGKEKALEGIIGKMLTQMGKSSYHILCAQMMWFIATPLLKKVILYKFSGVVNVGISIVVCCVVGCIWYEIEKKLRDRYKM